MCSLSIKCMLQQLHLFVSGCIAVFVANFYVIVHFARKKREKSLLTNEIVLQ